MPQGRLKPGNTCTSNRPHITTSTAERLTTMLCSKILFIRPGLFGVVEVMPTPMTIDEDGIRNTVSVDHATVVPAKKTPKEDNWTQTKDNDAEREENHEGDTQAGGGNVVNEMQEEAVHRILHHVGKG